MTQGQKHHQEPGKALNNMNCSLAVAEGKELGAVFPFFMKRQARKAECKTVTPGGSDGKESACNVGDLDLIPGLGRSPGGGHGNPLQYS